MIEKTTSHAASVSVYVPTFGRPQLLRRALASLAAQTVKDFQVVVCEDPSSESCASVIAEFRKKLDNLVFFQNDRRRGSCYSRNRLIAASDGEYITGLDDDDLFEPTRIQEFVNHPRRDEAAFLCSTSLAIDAKWPHADVGRDRWIDFGHMRRGNPVGNQVFARTEYLRELGGFDERMPAWQDFDLWFRLTKTFGAGFRIDNRSYRVDRSPGRARITTSEAGFAAFDLFIAKHGEELDAYDRALLLLGHHSNRNISLPWSTMLRGQRGLPIGKRADIAQRYLRYNLGRRFPKLKKRVLSLMPRLDF